MITLLSDLGLQDPSVAIAKGIIMQHASGQQITDITHEVLPFNTRQAAYLLQAGYKSFPPGTCHILLFDIFARPAVRLLLTEYDGHFFLSSDNNVVASMLRGVSAVSWLCSDIPNTDTFATFLHTAGNIANHLNSQTPGNLGLQPFTLAVANYASKQADEDGAIPCDVLHVDHFGNIVIDFHHNDLPSGAGFRLQFAGMEDITVLSNSYSDVRAGYKLCRINSHGYMELCINRGRATDIFGLRPGSKFNDIKIYIQ